MTQTWCVQVPRFVSESALIVGADKVAVLPGGELLCTNGQRVVLLLSRGCWFAVAPQPMPAQLTAAGEERAA